LAINDFQGKNSKWRYGDEGAAIERRRLLAGKERYSGLKKTKLENVYFNLKLSLPQSLQ
jgi:hypothetical protein